MLYSFLTGTGEFKKTGISYDSHFIWIIAAADQQFQLQKQAFLGDQECQLKCFPAILLLHLSLTAMIYFLQMKLYGKQYYQSKILCHNLIYPKWKNLAMLLRFCIYNYKEAILGQPQQDNT